MYFQLDNTPENVRRMKESEKPVQEDVIPQLELAPFTSHPMISFENIPLNSVACRTLQIYNPPSYDKQVTFVKPPPTDIGLELSWSETVISANDTAILELRWSPKTPVSQRFTMQIADQKKRRFDVIVVCKTAVTLKPKIGRKKGPVAPKQIGVPKQKSPKTKTKRSPKTKFYIPCGDKYKNIMEVTTNITEEVTKQFQKSPLKRSYFSTICPELQNPAFSSNSTDTRRDTYLVNDPDYDKENDCSFQMRSASNNIKNDFKSFGSSNILSAIDNLSYTPLKMTQKYYRKDETVVEKHEYILSESPRKGGQKKNVNKVTKSHFDLKIDNIDEYSFDKVTPMKKQTSEEIILVEDSTKIITDKTYDENISDIFLIENNGPRQIIHNANLTHSIIDLCDVTINTKPENVTTQPIDEPTKPTITVSSPYQAKNKYRYFDENRTNNEISGFTPNPKNNLSEINISLEGFNPNRCSTERKDCDHKTCKTTSINDKVSRELLMSYSPGDALNTTYGKLSSGTYTKGDSPIIPLRPSNQSSPYSVCGSPPVEPIYKVPAPPAAFTLPRKLPFSENSRNFLERADLMNANKERNMATSAKSIIEANLWPRTPPSPSRPKSPLILPTILEESTMFEMSMPDTSKRCDTFIINKTFEIPKPVKPPTTDGANTKWNKTGLRMESKKTTVIHQSFKKEVNMSDISDVQKDAEYSYTNVKSVSTTMDPFLASTCLYDERAYDELQTEFKKWLNYLLTPPADLETNLDASKMDVGKAWIESRAKTIPTAPTKEQVSSKYHTSHRLESLRKSAKAFSEKQHIREVFIKVTNQVEKKLLSVREDKHIHVNIGLQNMILKMLLCYNPLWLRIGLETLYGRNVPLTNNNDIMGLSSFIIEYMFKDPYTNTKHSTNLYTPQYIETMKKFTLKKFLILVYFLDQAKLNKVIPHDPCLFCRNALYKDSKELLVQFTKEVISGVGDITKHLKPTGYVVSHKQTYLHEFKYGVNNLAVDLKDGVRLTRLMEIILMKNDLTSGLRTPAISRLQKIHNVKIALTALESAGFTILGDITPKDIADGHREKTLSLLWQLINKFRAPLFCQSALVIQKWWRKKYLRIFVNKRIEYRKNYKFHQAATNIQSWWRNILRKRRFALQLERETNAAIIIQKYWRMWQCRNRYLKYVKSITTVQKWFRSVVVIKNAKTFVHQLRMESAATKIQKWYRLKKQRQFLASQNTERERFLQIRKSVTTIQTAVRAYLAMKEDRKVYIKIRTSTIKIQQYYRAIIIRRYVRQQYLQLKTSTIYIQRKYRANLLKSYHQEEYIRKRNAIIQIQQFYRGWLLRKQIRKDFLTARTAAVTIQRFIRARCAMKEARKLYLQKKHSAVMIQKYIRGYLQMNIDRRNYLEMKAAIEHKRRETAALVIQRKYRAYLEMETFRGKYLILRSSTIKIQKIFRSYLVTKSIRREFLTLKSTTLFIQRKYRAKLDMLKCLKDYEGQKKSALIIQRFYRSYRAKKREQAAITIQKYCKGILAKRKYIQKRNAAVAIQSYFKMYLSRKKYLEMKKSVIIIQNYYRNILLMRKIRNEYENTRLSIIKIQSVLRMYIERRKYLQIRYAVILIQKLYRRKLENNKQKLLRQTFASIVIQTAWRRYVQYNRFKKLRASAIVCQNVWRSILQMREQRNAYVKLRNTTIKLQGAIREYLLCKSIKNNAATKIQNTWRMYTTRKEFQILKKHTIVCQQRWRAILEMRKCRTEFEKVKCNITRLQAVTRGYLVRKNNSERKRAAIRIQTAWRKYASQKRYNKLKTSAIALQQKWRSILIRRYIVIRRTSIIKIQTTWRCYIAQKRYKQLRQCVILCQQKRRSVVEMRKCKEAYKKLRGTIVKLQAAIRGYIARQQVFTLREESKEREKKIVELKAAVVIQKHWRGYEVRKKQAEHSRVAKLRRRWQQGALESDQLTLAERNEDAMDVLCHFKDVASVIRAFKTLDYVTKVYPMMYGTGDTALPIITRLVAYMGATNRSVSTLETLQLGAAILLNLTKYTPTAHYVYKVEHVDTILTLMLHWCDKDGLLSRLFCTLLWMFGKYDDITKDLSEFLKNAKSYKILCKVRTGLVRRRRMDSRKRCSVRLSLPAPACKLLNDSSRLSMTPAKAGKLLASHLPATEPDYGIERTKQPDIFTDELQAIDAVFLKFDLPFNMVSDY